MSHGHQCPKWTFRSRSRWRARCCSPTRRFTQSITGELTRGRRTWVHEPTARDVSDAAGRCAMPSTGGRPGARYAEATVTPYNDLLDDMPGDELLARRPAGPRPPRSKRRRANVDDRPDHSRSTPTGKRNNPVAWHQIHRLALRHTGKGVIQSCVTTGLVGWLSTNGSRGRRWRIPDNHRTPGVPSTSPARAERLTTLRRIAGGSFIILAKVPTQMHVHGLPSVVCCSLRTRSRRPG